MQRSRSRAGALGVLVLVAGVAAGRQAGVGDVGVGPGGPHAGRGGPLSAPPRNDDYRALTNDLSDVANLNVETSRGVLVHGPSGEIWALNTHGSTLNRYDPLQGQPTDRYPTVLNPVALALWSDDLLVVGAGTRALARHDRATGRILSVVPLPSEPFDCAVEPDRDVAWIACMGAGVVVEVDLAAMAVVRTLPVPGRRAAHLFLDAGVPGDPSDDELFVAPQLSGNNSLVVGQPKSAVIVDGEDPAAYPGGGLPDTDLVSFDTQTGARTDWGTDQGTLLFAHGRNPVTGAYWILNTESINKDPALQTEPDLKGVFAENRVSITDFGAAGALPAEPDQVVSLDVVLTGTPGEPQPVSLPTGLAFDAAGGAWVTSPTTDLVAYLDASGVRQPQKDVQLPAGAIPRSFTIEPSGARGLAYGWGTNTVYAVSLSGPDEGQVVFQYDLGLDPLPAFLRAGREHFYDAHNSANGRTTCGSCHPGGGADGLAWSIPDSPIDEKAVMVTQSLIGIAHTFPHHWRGERDLVDFNVAFAGLLGGAELDATPGGDLDEFVAFVQSLTSHANPRQHVSRRVWDDRSPEVLDGFAGSAVNGQRVYNDVPSDSATATCTTCHFNPLGSPGDVFDETESAVVPAQTQFEVAPFNNVFPIKDQPVVSVQTATGTTDVQELGAGWVHNGTVPDLFSFAQTFALLTPQEQRDVTAFLRQFDTGLSAGAQAAWHLAGPGAAAVAQEVAADLLPQAGPGWLDVVAFGTDDLTGPLVPSSWLFDPAAGTFESDDPARPPLSLATLAAAAAAGSADLVVMGVPPGNGFRVALDRDVDGLVNGAEAGLGCDPYVSDSDGDGFPDGYEVTHGSDPLDGGSLPVDTTPPAVTSLELDFVNARLAKYRWTTDEPVTVRLTYFTGAQPGYAWEGRFPTTRHTSVLTFDESSALAPNTFVVAARLTDLSGNQVSFPFASFDAGTMINPNNLRLLRAHDTAWIQSDRLPGGVLDARVELYARWKESAPPYTPAEDVVVVAQVLVEDLPTGRFTIAAPQTSLPTSLVVDPAGAAVYDGLPGPFLVLPPTDAAGRAEADFVLSGLTAGQRVKFNVLAIEPAGPGYDPNQPVFLVPTLADYNLPTTQPADRCVELAY